MKISYNWLCEYLDVKPSPDRVADILTASGLEVESVETMETVRGGMMGLVVGEVVSCTKHPNAERLSITIVDTGGPYHLPIVCGAPNVAAGQKVIVAPVGSTLYGGEEPITIKKVKIRGEISEGMICAEDEIGLGNDHSGILVLPEDIPIGTSAADCFNLENDTLFEIGLTPNRIDGASHMGVARDLVASIGLEQRISLILPDLSSFKADNLDIPIKVTIEDPKACVRYSGVSITGITIAESPEWLKNRIRSIGLSPINNVVDITNFVLHETGQPLHAFDAKRISGNQIIVKPVPDGTQFVSLDELTRTLTSSDLMICNSEEGMCIAGVFGGLKSGVSNETTELFLESACFNPVWVRKTSKHHQLFTDSSFRFERGTDPNGTLFALKRAALLIQEIAGGKIASDIVDIYPEPIAPYPVSLSWKNLDRLVGLAIDRDLVRQILKSLDIEIVSENPAKLNLAVATYRVDVRREADVIEEILRIYGYNNVGIDDVVHSTLSYSPVPDPEKLENLIAEQLVGQGMMEIMNSSLTRGSLYKELNSHPGNQTVELMNPLSNDLNAMRQTLLFGGLETISLNIKHKNQDLSLFEFGNVYRKNQDGDPLQTDGYTESRNLALFLTGKKTKEHWQVKPKESGFFDLKSIYTLILSRIGIPNKTIEWLSFSDDLIETGALLKYQNKKLGWLGLVRPEIGEQFDINQEVWYGNLNWSQIISLSNLEVRFRELSKFPEVRRDLSMILDQEVTFAQIKNLAYVVERKLLKEMNLFDLFESQKIGADKKSVAVSFILQDSSKTLTDKDIDRVMDALIRAFEKKLGAVLR